MLEIIKELEGKSHAQRRENICQLLEAWEVPFQVHTYRTGINLFVKASTPNCLGISSHYDVVPNCPGANDNASAIAVTLELVRRLQQYNVRQLGLQFFFFDEEECGLKGSQAYVSEFGYQGMKGLYNFEMVGRGDQLALWPLKTESEGSLLSALEKQCRLLSLPSHRFDDLLTLTSDHMPFRRAGLKDAFSITCISSQDLEVAGHYYNALATEVNPPALHQILTKAPLFEHYHQPSDRSDYLQESALQLVANTVWSTYLAFDQQ
ncbi:M28 family peptidase [Hymenobacter sp. BT664]|uniref:M28 family peptidase n=1 Tax=Hymenobacter montanus TaxID=2771359 RepID=A0A927BHH2_9BACT|nr:M28 family peptidase [Hymenobacter montanus]MBD2770536.1 M28 family peptidase [Hymenobacter montanus]